MKTFVFQDAAMGYIATNTLGITENIPGMVNMDLALKPRACTLLMSST